MHIEELRAEMARKSISIPQLAEKIGVTKKTMYSRMSGETAFKQFEIQKISEILDFSDADIIRIFFTEKVS